MDQNTHLEKEKADWNASVTELTTAIKPQARKPHDPNVTLEEYLYYAKQTREEEKSYEPPKLVWRELLKGKKAVKNDNGTEKQVSNLDFSTQEARMNISDEEWVNASRALRSASVGACFYLITTDILGPFGVSFALGTLGWGPGIALFTVFGVLAGYSGYLLWKVFLGVDSYQFPCMNYGDVAFRTWGRITRHITNFLQGLALLLLLGQVTIQFGENISAMSKFNLCYIVCPLLFVIVGFFLTQIRTLRQFGIVANASVWLNILVILMTMGFVAHSPPNFAISVLGSAGSAVDPTTITPDKAGNYPPVMHYTKLPVSSLVGSINGLLSGVLAYAGAQLFIEFMAEMKRPNDFIKAMWGGQLFIYTVYMVYGCFVYYYQGQYSFNPSYLGVSKFSWQTSANAISLVSALIAAALYGNIGIKVVYNNILVDIFRSPPLVTKKGKIIYAVMVPIWWSLAFLIAAAIPDYFGFVSVMSASCLLNLTYTLPPFFALGYDIQRHAIRHQEGEGFDPITGQAIRFESGFKRYIRGFMSGGTLQVAQNIWNLLYFLASLAMCGLGMYAAVDGMIEAFKNPQLTSFSCRSPLDLSA